MSNKLKIDDCIKMQLDGTLYDGVENFIQFLRSEKVSLPWSSNNGYDLKHKGKKVGKIYFRMGRNFVELNLDTANGNDFDLYLEGQPENVIETFISNANIKCAGCRPHLECNGRTIDALGNSYNDACINTVRIHFTQNSGDFSTMSHKLSHATAIVPIETIKDLILARMSYIERTR